MDAGRIVQSERRRGFGRAAAFLVLVVMLVASGCGRHGAATDSERAADVAILNDSFAAELTALADLDRALPQLKGEMLAAVGKFRGQDQAHLDAITKAIRGLGGEVEAEAAELETPGPRTRAEALTLAYEGESAALAQDLAAPSRLQTAAPRAVTAAVGANHAQHLVVLRQGLGAPLRNAVPQPFESGEPPPSATPPAGVEASK